MAKTLTPSDLDTQRWMSRCVEMSPGTNLYVVPGASVFVSNNVLDFPVGQHRHDEYEFVMPLNEDMLSKTGEQDVLTEKQRLTPFNSGQSHGPGVPTKVNKMICIQCEKDFLDELCLQTFGKSNVVFDNISFDIGNNMRFLLGLFIDESIGKSQGYALMQDSLIKMLLMEIIRRSSNSISETITKGSPRGSIKRAIDFLEEQLARPLSNDQVAAVAGMSSSYFIREFKAYTGKTPYSFFIDLKVEKAKELLLNKNMSITEAAQACGFSSPGHFSTVFKQKIGTTPSEYKKTTY